MNRSLLFLTRCATHRLFICQSPAPYVTSQVPRPDTLGAAATTCFHRGHTVIDAQLPAPAGAVAVERYRRKRVTVRHLERGSFRTSTHQRTHPLLAALLCAEAPGRALGNLSAAGKGEERTGAGPTLKLDGIERLDETLFVCAAGFMFHRPRDRCASARKCSCLLWTVSMCTVRRKGAA
jgi:hypothetical protein